MKYQNLDNKTYEEEKNDYLSALQLHGFTR